jgi:hypothetical protein
MEIEIGKELFEKVFKILSEKMNCNLICYDYDNLVETIKQECYDYDESLVELCVTKIPDLYCLVIRKTV